MWRYFKTYRISQLYRFHCPRMPAASKTKLEHVEIIIDEVNQEIFRKPVGQPPPLDHSIEAEKYTLSRKISRTAKWELQQAL